MGHLRRLKPGRTLLWSMMVFVVCIAGYPNPGLADVSVGVFIVDGVRYQTIGQAYADCINPAIMGGNYHYSRCEIWDYNLVNGEVMNSLPWDPNGGNTGYTPFDLHLGPGTLKICDALCGSSGFTFVIPRLSRVTGAGRTSALPGGTVIQAGSLFTANPKTLVQIGDADGSTSFGSILSSVTVDCNYVPGCTGIENSGGQEQSGLEHVNVVNYAIKGIWIHSAGAQNSHYTDVEVNGCLSQPSCTNGITPVIGAATVPLEIDNVPALRPIEGITVNPVNTSNSSIQSISTSGSDIAFTVSGSGFVSSLNSSPNTYVTISGVLLSHSGGVNFNGTYLVASAPPGSVFHLNVTGLSGTCSATCGGTASLVPTSDVVVCSGTSVCADTIMGSPTTVTFIGPHFENAGKGIDATGGTGAQTTLNVIGGSCPITGTTMGPNATGSYSDVSYCAFFESAAMGGHIENLFGGLATTYTLEDDNFTPSYQTKDKFIELYDFGSDNGSGMRTRHCSEPSCMNQVPSLAIYGSGGTAAISTTGTNQPLVLSPPGTGFVEINNAGTAATPSFVFTDTTTGFYKSGTNTWGWSANGIGEFIFAGQGIRLSNSTVYQMSPSYNTAADTGMSRCTTTTGSASAGTVCIGSGSPQSATGILHSGMTSALTSATTISSTSFVTTNIVLPALPISMVQGFECDVIFKQAATLTSDLFAIGASNTPTAIWVMAQPFNSTYAAPKYTTITSSTITPIVLPLMPGAPGADYDLHISGALSTTSSNPVQLTLYAQISSGGGALTIEAGSQCHYTP